MLYQVFILSMLPISELRGAIPFGIGSGLGTFSVVITAIIGNLLIMPVVFLFMNTLHKQFVKWSFYDRMFNKFIEKKRQKLESKVGTKAEAITLFLFTAIPLPFTGAYTASILAWFFGIKFRKSFIAVSLGVLVAAILVTLATLGFVSIF